MISLYDSKTADVLPESMKDAKTRALCYAFDNQMKKFISHQKCLEIWSNVDSVSDDKLDILATENRVLFYSPDLPPETKRKMIKNSLYFYMKLGTSQAMTEMIDIVFEDSQTSIKQWYEYAGKPYTFRISTDAEITPEIDSFFNEMIHKVKNVRSHLESISIARKLYHNFYIGSSSIAISRPPTIRESGHRNEGELKSGYVAGNALIQTYKPNPIIEGSIRNERVVKADYVVGNGLIQLHKPQLIINMEERI